MPPSTPKPKEKNQRSLLIEKKKKDKKIDLAKGQGKNRGPK